MRIQTAQLTVKAGIPKTTAYLYIVKIRQRTPDFSGKVGLSNLVLLSGHLLQLPPIHPGLLGQVGINLVLGLVTACCGRQTACWRPGSLHLILQSTNRMSDN